MNGEFLYLIGLMLVLLFIIFGIDDFFWDLLILFKRVTNKTPKIEIAKIDQLPPKLIAVVIAAWHEDNVLNDVVENIVISQHYPKSMYHIFLGVYPNDAATVYIAKQLAERYPNVHCVENYKDGPTSKAQNINYLIRKIKEYERERDWSFQAITVHDSEDLVHPYELKVTNHLLNHHDAIQFPVFPLIKKPTIFNYFKYLTTNTYVDEFAENHFITMVGRNNTGAFVPSAGTGFSLSRQTIDMLGDAVLPENSLTEDYRLSLTLYEQGTPMYYVLEELERVDYQGKKKSEFIATRSMFPNTFKTAVRQKTRWTLGITMQSVKFRDIFQKGLSLAGRYSLYRDQKAKIGNLLSMVGYPVLIYFLFSLFFDIPPIYPKYSFSWYLSLIVTIMMIERQAFRAVSLNKIYGLRSVFFGCFFPPLVPLRIVYGNIINLVATIKAYFQFVGGRTRKKAEIEEESIEEIEKRRAQEKEVIEVEEKIDFEWSKTEHSFLDKSILARFHRYFGDVVIAKGHLSAKELKDLLANKDDETFIGEYLVANKIIEPKDLVEILSALRHVPHLHDNAIDYYHLGQFKYRFSRKLLIENNCLPIATSVKGVVFAISPDTPESTKQLLESKYEVNPTYVLTSNQSIKRGIELIYQFSTSFELNLIEQDFDKGNLSVEQLVIIRNHQAENKLSDQEILNTMGLCTQSYPKIKEEVF